MSEVIIYTTTYCPYCWRAKKLLDQKGVAYQEIDVTHDSVLRKEMTERSGRQTVPQIFIQGQSIGGSDDLYALEASGVLDSLLAAGRRATGRGSWAPARSP